MNDEDGKQQTPGAGTRVGSTSEFIAISDGDDPVPNPEFDKFNLTNQIRDEEVTGTKTIGGGEASSQTEEQRDREFVRVKYESYWEQKEEKLKQKIEKERIQAQKEETWRQEMEALKESMKHAQEVGEGTSKSLDRVSKISPIQQRVLNYPWRRVNRV